MKYLKAISYRLKDKEQLARLDALAYYEGKSMQEILDIALEEYYMKKSKANPKLEKIKRLHSELDE